MSTGDPILHTKKTPTLSNFQGLVGRASNYTVMGVGTPSPKWKKGHGDGRKSRRRKMLSECPHMHLATILPMAVQCIAELVPSVRLVHLKDSANWLLCMRTDRKSHSSRPGWNSTKRGPQSYTNASGEVHFAHAVSSRQAQITHEKKELHQFWQQSLIVNIRGDFLLDLI